VGDPAHSLVELGRIVSAYGIKGWVKVQPHSAQAQTLLSVRQWYLGGDATCVRSVTVLAARAQGSAVVAHIQGVVDRNQAERLRGQAVCVPRSAFAPLEDDEVYWVDLLGCLVYGEHNGQSVLLGRVTDVTDNGAHALLKVERLALSANAPGQVAVLDAKGRPVETLVPFVRAHLRAVDLAARRIDTDWPVDF